MHSYDFSNHFYLTCVRCNKRATRAGGSLSGWMVEDGFQSAMMVRPVCPECAQGDEKRIPYGYCPTCGAIGLYRERRPDGDDVCANGHTYKSSSALKSPHQPPPVPVELPLADKDAIALARVSAAFLLGMGCTTSAEAISEVCDRLERRDADELLTLLEMKFKEVLADTANERSAHLAGEALYAIQEYREKNNGQR